MNKTAIKNYAIWARTKLIEDIKYKAGLLGISEKEIAAPLAQSTNEVQYFAIGTRNPYAISGVQIAQRASLANAIKRKAQEVDYKTAYNQIVEEVAYTWFNRFIAVRFMEVNEYLPCKIRVLSAVDGRQEPDIVQNPFDAKLDYTPSEENLINEYQLNNEGDKLFNLLFIKACNDLSKVLPQLFEAEDDYTELLLNISYTDRDGLIYKLVHDIPEEDFNVQENEDGERTGQVEIIGWLYQYYNTEPKNETFALLKKNVKITKERIPSATQLFTPDWIVRYMVENSLGRMWVEGHPNDFLKSQWKYYLEEADQEESVKVELAKIREQYAQLQPEDIKVIDPCMGSGHILVYAFEVLMQIYTQMGYAEKEAAISILENNLYGLDIDERAFQLAYFAVMMKARQYHKFILKKQVQCHIYPIVESNGIKVEQLQYFGAQLDEFSKNSAMQEMHGLIKDMHDAKEYGSIVSVGNYNWELLHQFVAEFDASSQMDLFATYGIEKTQQWLKDLVAVGEILGKKYEVVVTNPPYMGASGMSVKLSEYVKKNYPNSKADLFAVFMEKADFLVKRFYFTSLITMESWMFLSSFEKLREIIGLQKTIINMVHMPYLGKGGTSLGINFGTAAVVMQKGHTINYNGQYEYTVYYECNENGVPFVFPTKNERWTTARQENFSMIPGVPIAYWCGDKLNSIFKKGQKVGELGSSRSGMQTGDNAKFLRLWHEVSFERINFNVKSRDDAKIMSEKWIPQPKGGPCRKWYGNFEYVVNFANDGYDLHNFEGTSIIKNPQFYFKEGISWSHTTSKAFSARYMPSGCIFNVEAPAFYPILYKNLYYILGFFNTKVLDLLFAFISQTMHYMAGDMAKIPVMLSSDLRIVYNVSCLSKSSVDISKAFWDYFETSWDFQKHPLMPKLPVGSDTLFIDNNNN